ncbi:hypothetical protein HY732_03555, partial [Candidatus Uhrbacteria bacterium]|nr:hypothetical protein [Candidatus Uhrbacteria bacterium]
FDFLKKNYGISEHDRIRGKHSKYVWQVSETFNAVIENWKPYRRIFDSKEHRKPYPGCEKMFQTMTRQWARRQDIEYLLDKWFGKKKGR